MPFKGGQDVDSRKQTAGVTPSPQDHFVYRRRWPPTRCWAVAPIQRILQLGTQPLLRRAAHDTRTCLIKVFNWVNRGDRFDHNSVSDRKVQALRLPCP